MSISGLFRRRKRIVEVSAAFRRLRACYHAYAPLRIMGNLHNVHDHPRFLALLRHLHIHTVWTPTDASWLNAIEAHFGVTKRAILTGSDDRDHVPNRRRIYRYLHYRNRRVDRQDHPLTRIRSVRPQVDRH
jgi:hypothetical protein